MQQDVVKASDVSNKIDEEQERSSNGADEERISAIARVRAGSDCEDSCMFLFFNLVNYADILLNL